MCLSYPIGQLSKVFTSALPAPGTIDNNLNCDRACQAFYLILIDQLHHNKCSLNYPIGQLSDFLHLPYSHQVLCTCQEVENP